MRTVGLAITQGTRTTAYVQLVTQDVNVKVCTPDSFENSSCVFY